MKKNFNEHDAEEALDKESAKFSIEKLKKVLDNEKKISNKFTNDTNMLKYFADFKLFFSLLKDYFSGRYKSVPWRTIAAVGGTLIYVLSPIDFMPDIIPILGLTDDAAVFALCLKLVSGDLKEYQQWKEMQNTIMVVDK